MEGRLRSQAANQPETLKTRANQRLCLPVAVRKQNFAQIKRAGSPLIPHFYDHFIVECPGTNNPKKAREVCEFLSQQDMGLVGLLEHKIKEKNLEKG